VLSAVTPKLLLATVVVASSLGAPAWLSPGVLPPQAASAQSVMRVIPACTSRRI
jgi:hypothetical protein